MYPQHPQINPYDPKTLDALGEAFDATWVVLQARDPFRDFERAYELRTALSQKLVALAADGVTDPIELREPLRASRDNAENLDGDSLSTPATVRFWMGLLRAN